MCNDCNGHLGQGTMRKVAFVAAVILLAAVSIASAADSATYVYDLRGRLVTVTYVNGTTITYTYDVDGNRTVQSVVCSAGGC
jgi:YD repeat-containing protein